MTIRRYGSGGGGGGGGGPYYSNPSAVWWLNGQTERWPSSFPYTVDTANNKLRMRFSTAAAAEAYEGGGELIGDIFTGVSSDDADTSGAPALSTSRVFFTPPPGRYRLSVVCANTLNDASSAFSLFQITAGVDDQLLQYFIKHSTGGSNQLFEGGDAGWQLYAEDFVVSPDEVFYLQISGGGNGDLRGYMRLEKTA